MDKVELKNNCETKLIEILQKYFYKYIMRVYDSTNTLKDLQKFLLKIPKWTENNIDKEYTKFLTKIKESQNISEEHLSKLSELVFTLNNHILIDLYDIDVNLKIPTLKLVWYKCLKQVSKYFYKHPKLLKMYDDEEISSSKIKIPIHDVVKITIYKFIPITTAVFSKEKIKPELKYYNYDVNCDSDTDTPHAIHNLKELNVQQIKEDNYDLLYLLDEEEEFQKSIESASTPSNTLVKEIKLPNKKHGILEI